jgi:hypothetical protein
MTLREKSNGPKDYLSYMLRLWRDSGAEEGHSVNRMGWRASLQSPYRSNLIGFASLDDLFAFLRRQAGLDPAAPDKQQER